MSINPKRIYEDSAEKKSWNPAQKEAFDELKKIAVKEKQITLLFSVKNVEENQAVILKEKLK